jgi:hypothetical protein
LVIFSASSFSILLYYFRDKEEDIGLSNNLAIALGSLLVLICFLSIGAYFFSICEHITFFDAFYFCFITMTTIGFGDIVPGLNTGKIINTHSSIQLHFN